MRKLSRRKLAVLIRVRQELHKRLDAVLPADRGDASFADLFDRSVVGDPAVSNGTRALCDSFRARALQRYPLSHLETRPQESLADRDDVIEAARKVAAGQWELFGRPLIVDLQAFEWTRHPVTGVRADDVHWTRVAYMAGVGGGDVKQMWELSRHAELVRLAQAYYLTRDDKFARVAIELLDSWIEENPPGHGVNWTSTLEVAFRAIAWCWIWTLTCGSAVWSDLRLARFLRSISQHARHIERFDSVHHSPNTHLTGEAIGLLYVGLIFPELARAREWTDLARAILDEELDHQVFPDGMHFERATGYHRYTLEFYVHYLLLAGAFGLPVSDHLRRRVGDLAGASWLLQRPDGSWPIIGDEDSGNTLRLSSLGTQDQRPALAVAAALSGSAVPNDPIASGAAWWLLPETDWRRLLELQRQQRALPMSAGTLESAGYYVGRRGEWYCVVDAGPHGGDRTGHAHTDLGHIEIAHATDHLVVDPGCAVYTTDPVMRDLARSERVHACMVVDREPLAAPAGPFAWTRLSPTPSVQGGDKDGVWWCDLVYTRAAARGTFTHRRQVVLVGDAGVIVCDWLTGELPGGMAAHWPLGACVDDLTLHGDTLGIGRHRVRWTSSGTARLQATLEPLSRSPGYGRVEAARLLRVAFDATAPMTLATTFTATTTSATVEFSGSDRVCVTLGGAPGVEFVLAPGVAPAHAAGAVPRSRPEGVLR